MLKQLSNIIDSLLSEKVANKIGLSIFIILMIDAFLIIRINKVLFELIAYIIGLFIGILLFASTVDLFFYRLPKKINYKNISNFKSCLGDSFITLTILGLIAFYFVATHEEYLNETAWFFMIIFFHIIITLWLSYIILKIIMFFSKKDDSSYYYPILYKTILIINFIIGAIFVFFYFQFIRFASVNFEIQKLDPNLNDSLIHQISDYSGCIINSEVCTKIEYSIYLLRFDHFFETPLFKHIEFYFHTYIFLFCSSLAPSFFKMIKHFYRINE